MPSISGLGLTLKQMGANVMVRVQYNIAFSALELHMGANGLRFRERIRIIGIDPPGSATGTEVAPNAFPSQYIQVPPVPPNPIVRTATVTRSALQEDVVAIGVDPDELRAKVEIDLIGLPISASAFTDQVILPG